MKKIAGMLVLVWMLVMVTTARAEGIGPCIPGNGSGHCYAISENVEGHLGAVAAFQLRASGMVSNEFTDAEMWALCGRANSAGGGGCWVETGIMAMADGKLHAFYAEEHEGSFYSHIIAGEPFTETPNTYYFTVVDREHNGCWEPWTLLSTDSGGQYWKARLARYCGLPEGYERVQAGSESSPSCCEAKPAFRGSASVWADDAPPSEWWRPFYISGWSEWQPWFTYYFDSGCPNACGLIQSTMSPTGSTRWEFGPEPTTPAVSTLKVSKVNTAMTVTTGKALKASKIGMHPHGYATPSGIYRARIKARNGLPEDEYVGPTYPVEAKVRAGGSE